jgi:hypothetical protein
LGGYGVKCIIILLTCDDFVESYPQITLVVPGMSKYAAFAFFRSAIPEAVADTSPRKKMSCFGKRPKASFSGYQKLSPRYCGMKER